MLEAESVAAGERRIKPYANFVLHPLGLSHVKVRSSMSWGCRDHFFMFERLGKRGDGSIARSVRRLGMILARDFGEMSRAAFQWSWGRHASFYYLMFA